MLFGTAFDPRFYSQIRFFFPPPPLAEEPPHLRARHGTPPNAAALMKNGHFPAPHARTGGGGVSRRLPRPPPLPLPSSPGVEVGGEAARFAGGHFPCGRRGSRWGGSQVRRRRKRQAVKCKRTNFFHMFQLLGERCQAVSRHHALKWARVLPSRPVTTHL